MSIILISGPPGAGKSTVAKLIVERSTAPIAYIEGDAFWQFIAKTTATKQHDGRILIQAMIAAAARFARGGYETIVDFTIGPWAFDAIRKALKDTPLDYVVLCPSEAECARRAAARTEGAMADYAPYRELHAAFRELGAFERHAIRSDTSQPSELAAQIRTGLAAGTYRVG